MFFVFFLEYLFISVAMLAEQGIISTFTDKRAKFTNNSVSLQLERKAGCFTCYVRYPWSLVITRQPALLIWKLHINASDTSTQMQLSRCLWKILSVVWAYSKTHHLHPAHPDLSKTWLSLKFQLIETPRLGNYLKSCTATFADPWRLYPKEEHAFF